MCTFVLVFIERFQSDHDHDCTFLNASNYGCMCVFVVLAYARFDHKCLQLLICLYIHVHMYVCALICTYLYVCIINISFDGYLWKMVSRCFCFCLWPNQELPDWWSCNFSAPLYLDFPFFVNFELPHCL